MFQEIGVNHAVMLYMAWPVMDVRGEDPWLLAVGRTALSFHLFDFVVGLSEGCDRYCSWGSPRRW